MDITCKKCREPWENYAETAEERRELRRIKTGEGCPACDWGTSCPSCDGTGKQRAYSNYHSAHDCSECRDTHYLYVRRLLAPADSPYRYGYGADVKTVDPRETLVIKIGQPERGYSADGAHESVKILCPFCRKTAEPCDECEGTGRWDRSTYARDVTLIDDWGYSLMDACDEDITDYLSSGF